MSIVFCIILAIEAYYWLWWLPRNWKTNKEAVVFYEVVTGKKLSDG